MRRHAHKRTHACKRTHTHVRNCVCVFACKQTQTHADTSACAYICARVRTLDRIYAHAIGANERPNDATRTRVNIINASNAMPKRYLYTYVHAVDREQYMYSQTNANARKRTRVQINARKLIVAIDAWAISACKRGCILQLSGCTIII